MADSATGSISTPADAATQASRPLPRKQLTGIIGALAFGAFLMILNETVLTVALPSIMIDYGVSASTGQWLTTGFLLTVAVVIPLTGYLLQRYSLRGLFVFALSSFLIGLVLAVVAPTFSVLLVARVIQAIGTAIVLPLLMNTTLTFVPPKSRGTVMGLNSIVIAVGPAIGPTISGVIVNTMSWHWIFALMTPLAVVVLALGIIFIKVPSATRKVPVDVISVILSAFAFGGLVYAISTVGGALDDLTLPLVSGVIGVAALVIFIVRQMRLTRSGRELLNLQPFKNRNFRLSIIMIMIAMGTLLGTVVILPIFLQNGSGLSTMTIGMMLLPGGLVQIAVGPIFGRVYDRHGPRPVLIPGALMLALGQWLFTTVDPGTALGFIVMFHSIFCIGLAMLMTGLLSAALSDVPYELYGHGSAIFNTGQQLGGAVGTTIFVTVMSAVAAAESGAGSDLVDGLFDGAHIAFVIGGILATVAVICAPFIKSVKQA
ncbi:MDR family MFS transporter [Brevibacterium sp. ZH18]|uniref:MDR family MFS transporter n=1 Tax=Brevibacterium sp. ZH18 TaxID=2927784 RepID=UPI001F61FB9E|nr:MDR family MFS transporter [Brevibacterium sp. ZH18]MCI4012613.1 DHA2 family efflux MFS transporter permease subunit [Brevibacterium sp. ZH18]